MDNEKCGCSCTCEPAKKPDYIIGSIESSAGKISKVSTRFSLKDRLGAYKVRWGFGRMDYQIEPGLYTLGSPNEESPVLVTANYKLSFDFLRRELAGQNLWILVLDTKGVNVWCAAGKGTFGTEELIKRIKTVQLEKIVSHKKIILPQLGAPGISAHQVKKESGFSVLYGPVEASDLPEFLANGMQKNDKMRQVQFNCYDRLVLTPIELVFAKKYLLYTLAFFLASGLFQFKGFSAKIIPQMVPGLGAYFLGAVLVPVLLPFLIFRSFAMKGVLLAFIWLAGCKFIFDFSWIELGVQALILTPLFSFLALNFTGSTTFTSLSGVKKEVKIATPIYFISLGLGFLLQVYKLIKIC